MHATAASRAARWWHLEVTSREGERCGTSGSLGERVGDLVANWNLRCGTSTLAVIERNVPLVDWAGSLTLALDRRNGGLERELGGDHATRLRVVDVDEARRRNPALRGTFLGAVLWSDAAVESRSGTGALS